MNPLTAFSSSSDPRSVIDAVVGAIGILPNQRVSSSLPSVSHIPPYILPPMISILLSIEDRPCASPYTQCWFPLNPQVFCFSFFPFSGQQSCGVREG